ncbi:hypothetical protein D7B24_005220 [Verticillium nonalfalfae]|uniref:Uncharacterized protein n=1 Tax=Verticillium nonalfalfae TaxID=1051616 RepID=A0A3M9YD25_9PEZI|nr:uncharacterized protein D7B24_005220 [Verticillium nonalfalfae]RNJ58075.1 hypothetical protein D7B24_005220 [Verticillium nonalfalfae]
MLSAYGVGATLRPDSGGTKDEGYTNAVALFTASETPAEPRICLREDVISSETPLASVTYCKAPRQEWALAVYPEKPTKALFIKAQNTNTMEGNWEIESH